MKVNATVLLVGLSMMTVTSSVYAKTIHYAQEEIKLSDSVSPGEDFYRYVNQDWIDNAKLPMGMGTIDNFTQLYMKTEEQLNEIIRQLQTSPESDLTHNQRNVRNAYLSYLNDSAIEKAGLVPIQNDITAIRKAKNHRDIGKLMVEPIYRSFISYAVVPDAKAPDTYVLALSQGGLGLPERHYYVDYTPQISEIKSRYVDYIATLLRFAGENDPDKAAQQVVALETSMAQVHWRAEDDRDWARNYHPMSINDVQKLTPGIDWSDFINKWQLTTEQVNKIIVANDTAIEQLAWIFAKTPLPTLKSYLLFHYLDGMADYLPRAFSDASFKFRSTALYGIERQRSREARALAMVDALQGEPLGKLYVERHFNAQSKMKFDALFGHVRAAFKARLESNGWMDDATRQEALAKLNNFTVKVGYPERWRDYSGITLKPDALVDNVKQVLNWEYRQRMEKIGKSVPSWEWGIMPQNINAIYQPLSNEITFPAAFLQAPFFSPDADPAYNYGAIGAIIGHEMGHAFDDQGSLFDASGQLRNWWSERAKARFVERTRKLVAQYNGYMIDGRNVNGQLTLGENIGDLGGVSIALSAYQQFVKENYPDGKAPVIDGTTGLQRFFISWARTWRQLANKEMVRAQIINDPHSPNPLRVNGVVRNVDEWYQSFDIKKGEALYLEPQQRIRIW